MLKPLPIGIQDFRKLIEGGYLYVDKTHWIYDLIRNPSGVYFLARPRRFGKSLLLSTLEEIFRSNRALFHGLWLDDQPYDWRPFPVIRMDLSLYRAESAEHLKLVLAEMLGELGERAGIDVGPGNYLKRFRELIWRTAGDGRVVILVDEYDKPLLDQLDDLAEARRVREVLRGFYGIIKGMDAHIRFVMLTGVSKFSKVGVFSGLNNLEDISFDTHFATLLGMTEAELLAGAAGYLERLADHEQSEFGALLTRVRHWYNGFCFAADGQSVYNPFSLLLLLNQRRFGNFWFDTGTPTFLIKLIEQRGYDVRELDNLDLDDLAFSAYDLDELPVVPLLYQTGYVTIKHYDPTSRLYRLGYPNYEVEHAFLTYLLAAFTPADIGTAGVDLAQRTIATWEIANA
ncbi:AAA family ATPase [Candidatus Chloroploca sp. M-50]|uniref:AAA family ATPase n=1 Tax=Candidatus Chloroploca mongolica TaxID=2528176 RepID=A0ABS4D437_9CHLR|nr:AAA family ATPase [Candidatus Chloroploca mongolica]MBP1464213.1 AAA family ATPase [Candidatus Chloroploca mongolica]